MSMWVTVSSGRIEIDRAVFTELFDNSVVHDYRPYVRALETSKISFTDLVHLARTAHIPYPLFFAPLPVAHAQLEAKTLKLLQGLTKESFSLNARDRVYLPDVELVLKDLVRKQRLLRKYDTTLLDNPIAGIIRRGGASPREDVVKLRSALGMSSDAITASRTKEAAVETLIAHLEEKQVLVSRSVQGYMPQRVRGRISGLTVKDPKVPYIFLARGDKGDAQEPFGRQMFTLSLLLTLLAKGIFTAVTFDAQEIGIESGVEYDITGEFLMPEAFLIEQNAQTTSDVRSLADHLKVTPSALTVRLSRLGSLDRREAREMLATFRNEFAQRPKSNGRTPLPVNGIKTYNGREFSSRMLAVHDSGRMSAGEFCRTVGGNHIAPRDIPDFRAALR